MKYLLLISLSFLAFASCIPLNGYNVVSLPSLPESPPTICSPVTVMSYITVVIKETSTITISEKCTTTTPLLLAELPPPTPTSDTTCTPACNANQQCFAGICYDIRTQTELPPITTVPITTIPITTIPITTIITTPTIPITTIITTIPTETPCIQTQTAIPTTAPCVEVVQVVTY